MSVTLMHPVREATKIGREHGKAAASWVEIDASNARGFLDADENCELSDFMPSPLSGEYADGYSVAELLSNCDVSAEVADWSDENELVSYRERLADAYLDAFADAWTDEVVRVARIHAEPDADNCEGHESLAGEHMGESVFCDGSCARR